ncbi:Capsular polysaccharide synthesis enzyme CpsD, exopolysaccharide synthesis [Klebsiella aerogenes]|nr:Capsular polysaccharide synthesis enzyme CpsD, exopolysaccharide synthesis [Klebsiella aerogenes]
MITLMALALYIMYLIVSTALDKTVNSLSELKAKTALEASGEFPLLAHLENAQQIFHNVLYADMIHSLRLALLNKRDKTRHHPGDFGTIPLRQFVYCRTAGLLSQQIA